MAKLTHSLGIRLLLAGTLSLVAGQTIVSASNDTEGYRFSVAPEVWYVRWVPDYKEPDKNTGINATSYKLPPVFLYGLSTSLSYRGVNLTGSYLSSRTEETINSQSGNNSLNLFRQFRGEFAAKVWDKWYLKNRIVAGRFTGTATGTEWNYKGPATGTEKTLPIDTQWFQGELCIVFEQDQISRYVGAGIVVGYRYWKYNMPAQVWRYGVDSLEAVSFLDTQFTIQQLIIGLENLPHQRLGWSIGVNRFLVGLGTTRVDNAVMHQSSSWSAESDDSSISLEGDLGLNYAAKHLALELGVRMIQLTTNIGSNRRRNSSYQDKSGMQIYMTDNYFGPYAKLTVSF